jgi:hypothetical protein
MKYLLVVIGVFSFFQAFSCPMCNIHNYLDGSIQASKNIYKGKVIEEKEDGVFSIEVMEIFKMDEKKPFVIGDVKGEYLYPSIREIGSEFIFCDPFTSGLSFRILEPQLEYEVKYLMDSTRTISSPSQAVHLLEGISWSSYREAREYIEDNYSKCFDLLAERVVELRKKCQAKEDRFYSEHRLTNLMSGLLININERSKNLVLSEIESIARGDHGVISVDSLTRRRTSVINEYLRDILGSTRDTDFGDTLVKKYTEYVNSDSTSVITYFTYALAFKGGDALDHITMTDINRKYIVLGLVSAALWNDWYWQRDEIPPLLKKIEDFTPSEEVQAFVDKRFESYLKEDVDEEAQPKKDSFRIRGKKRKSIKLR